MSSSISADFLKTFALQYRCRIPDTRHPKIGFEKLDPRMALGTIRTQGRIWHDNEGLWIPFGISRRIPVRISRGISSSHLLRPYCAACRLSRACLLCAACVLPVCCPVLGSPSDHPSDPLSDLCWDLIWDLPWDLLSDLPWDLPSRSPFGSPLGSPLGISSVLSPVSARRLA